MTNLRPDGWYWVRWKDANGNFYDWRLARWDSANEEWVGYRFHPEDCGPRIPTPDELIVEAGHLAQIKTQLAQMRAALEEVRARFGDEPIHRPSETARDYDLLIRVATLVDEALAAAPSDVHPDTKRLNWLIEQRAFVLRDPEGYFVSFFDREPQQGFYETPRQAIDAAMQEPGGKS